MSKHILDRQRSRTQSQMRLYTEVERRTAPEGSNPAAKSLLRRKKGPMNAAMRNLAFMRIEREHLA